MAIRVIPVLDIKGGQAVRAIGGNRDHYRPLITRFHPDSDPLGVARGYRDLLNAREVYLADLDAIAGPAANQLLYQSIGALGLDLWVDAGIRDRTGLAPLVASGVSTVVVGLETIRGPAALAAIGAELPPESIVFSLDLRAGVPVFGAKAGAGAEWGWGTSDPFALACSAVALGIRRLLLLDLARVGMSRGTGTAPLLARLRTEFSHLEITVGGGIADRAEVQSLAALGANAVLIGSALHDGRIIPGDLC